MSTHTADVRRLCNKYSTDELPEECKDMMLELARERDELRRLGDDLVSAMKRSVDVGCTDHLDCAPDGGQFWYDAIKMWDK